MVVLLIMVVDQVRQLYQRDLDKIGIRSVFVQSFLSIILYLIPLGIFPKFVFLKIHNNEKQKKLAEATKMQTEQEKNNQNQNKSGSSSTSQKSNAGKNINLNPTKTEINGSKHSGSIQGGNKPKEKVPNQSESQNNQQNTSNSLNLMSSSLQMQENKNLKQSNAKSEVSELSDSESTNQIGNTNIVIDNTQKK